MLARLNANRAPESVEKRLALAATPMANTDRHDSFRAFDVVAVATADVDHALHRDRTEFVRHCGAIFNQREHLRIGA